MKTLLITITTYRVICYIQTTFISNLFQVMKLTEIDEIQLKSEIQPLYPLEYIFDSILLLLININTNKIQQRTLNVIIRWVDQLVVNKSNEQLTKNSWQRAPRPLTFNPPMKTLSAKPIVHLSQSNDYPSKRNTMYVQLATRNWLTTPTTRSFKLEPIITLSVNTTLFS